MVRVTSFTERRGWPRGIPCSWLYMNWGSSQLSRTSGRTTTALLSHGMTMNLRRAALFLASTGTCGWPDGERPPVGIFPGSDQENLGRVSTKRPTGGGLLLGVQLASRYEHPVSWGICGDRGGTGLAVGQEGREVVIFGVHNRRGVVQSPEDRLCGTAEVPPAGVGFCAACHPGHRDRVPSCIGLSARHVTPRPL